MLSSIGMSIRAVNWLRHSSINTSLSVISISEPNISNNRIHLNNIILQHLTENAAERFRCKVVLDKFKNTINIYNNNNNTNNNNNNTTFQCHSLPRHFFLAFAQSEKQQAYRNIQRMMMMAVITLVM